MKRGSVYRSPRLGEVVRLHRTPRKEHPMADLFDNPMGLVGFEFVEELLDLTRCLSVQGDV